MAEAVVNLRALRNEADWLPSDLDEMLAVRRVLIDAGTTRAVADSLVTWLAAKSRGEDDLTTQGTRSRYRKILASLESPLPSEQRSDSAIPVKNAA